MFKNIFNSAPTKHKEVVYEMTDFCFESAMLDISYVMEDSFFDVNRNHMIALHTGLKDNNVDILEEGFKDFIDGAVTFFKKLIDKVKEFMKKVFMYINAYIGDFERFLKRHSKALLEKYPDFSINGYKFTINDSVPNTHVIQDMLSEYNSEINNITNMTKADITKKRGQYMAPGNLDKMRAKVLGQSTGISKDDYSAECKKLFRNGETEATSIQVNHDMLSEIVNGYESMKKSYTAAKKEKDKLIALLESIKGFFQKGASLQYIDGKQVIRTDNISVNGKNNGINRDSMTKSEYKTDTMVLYNTYFNFRFAYSKEISTMCVNAMTERVNALKEQLAQSKTIVRRSLGASKEINGGDE